MSGFEGRSYLKKASEDTYPDRRRVFDLPVANRNKACTDYRRIAVVSPFPRRLFDLIGEFSIHCLDVLVFHKTDSLEENKLSVDLYIFDLCAEDVYDALQGIRSFVSRPDKRERVLFLADPSAAQTIDWVDAEQIVGWPADAGDAMPRILSKLDSRSSSAGTVSALPSASGVACKDITIDNKKMIVYRKGQTIELTKTEYQILLMMMQADGAVLTRDDIMNRIWGSQFAGGSNVVDVHIKGLRKKLGDKAETPQYIVTVRGVGYRLAD